MKPAFVIWSLAALLFVGIGLWSRFSKKAAGFFSNVKPPKVRDVAAYNRAVGNIWFAFAAGFELLGLPLLTAEQNSPLVFVSVLGTVFLLLGMLVAYVMIENKYRQK